MSGVGKTKSPLRQAALASLAAGVGTELLYAELLALVPPEDRELVGRALNLDREYSDFIRRTGDAIQWLLGQQHLTDEPIASLESEIEPIDSLESEIEPIDSRESEIVKNAARKFHVTAKGIERGFEGVQSKQVNYLKLRKLWPLKRFV